MTTLLPIKSMSQLEKFRAMEELWADLTMTEESYESPAWHLAALKETEQEISEGKVGFIPSEEAKRTLCNRAG